MKQQYCGPILIQRDTEKMSGDSEAFELNIAVGPGDIA